MALESKPLFHPEVIRTPEVFAQGGFDMVVGKQPPDPPPPFRPDGKHLQ
jgi:hypothetical protein